MKELYENWRRFLTEEEEETTQPPETSDGQKYLAKPKTQQALTVQKDPKKDPINSPLKDTAGSFTNIMSPKIKKQLEDLEKAPDKTAILINFEEYLNALYPSNLFPGGFKKVWKDAELARKQNNLPPLFNRIKPLKIIKDNQLENLGVYIPGQDALRINFIRLRKVGKDPIQTIVHELGHCINDGPNAGRLNAEAQEDLESKRGFELGKSYRPEETLGKGREKAGMGAENIYDELSNLGRIILLSFEKERPDVHEKIKDIKSGEGNNQILYVLSRSESQQRYYRPMKFWFAKLRALAIKQKKVSKIELPNLNLGNPYVLQRLLDFATPQDYENLATDIEAATKGTTVPQIRDYIVEKIRRCKEDPRANGCLMNKTQIYPEIVSTVKTEPQQSTSQVA